MTETALVDTDMQIGLAMVFGILGLVGALSMLAAGFSHHQVVAGWGFAVAVAAGSILVTVIHLYG